MKMGFLNTAERQEALVVHTAAGKVTVSGHTWPKARVWLMEDKTAVVITPDASMPDGVARQSYAVLVSEWNPRTKQLTAVLSDTSRLASTGDSEGEVLTVDAKGCGCNMGKVANAGPVSGPYTLTRVRQPDWHETVS